MKHFAITCLLLGISCLSLADNAPQLLQLTDYVGVDYVEAVTNGEVINPGEYAEMQDFSAAIVELAAGLPDSELNRQFTTQAQLLARLVTNRAPAREVKILSSAMRRVLISGNDMAVSPRQAPDLASASGVYSQQCAGCHGETGNGAGLLATSLSPPPTNFLDRARYRERSLLGLYNTITSGVQGTAMTAFTSLDEGERWSLAFYVGQLAVTEEERVIGGDLWVQGEGRKHDLARLESFTTLSPTEAEEKFGTNGGAIMAYLRTQPLNLFNAIDTPPLEHARRQLAKSLAAYQVGNKDSAYKLAIDAYLEGFELMEGNIDAVDAGLRREIEAAMTAYRNLIRKQAPLEAVTAGHEKIGSMLSTAELKLSKTRLSGKAAFFSALIILLREGLEALLVVAALAAFLIKTGRRDGLVYLYAGVAGAMALGAITWIASNTVVDISGAQRELTEGLAALFAAVVLFFVGFWMHSKTTAAQWTVFIESNMQKHLGRGTLWGLAGLAFIAVYREIFEVVLFYQALWMQSSINGQNMIFSGFVAAAVMLAILAWLILRYSTRLPLRQFFAASGIFMLILALIFTGKGIAALQEAGKIPTDPLDMPGFEMLGIYPNVEVIAVQLFVVAAAVLMVLRNRSSKDKRA